MDLLTAYYNERFRNEFREANANAFQNFFSKVMKLAYKDDFMATRTWGNIGDQKNDGFLISDRRLFQVYAPYDMEAKNATSKINNDFEGAKKHWKGQFDKWSFVHNAMHGLPAWAQHAILTLIDNHPDYKIDHWGYEKLKDIFSSLDQKDWIELLGPAPTEHDFTNLTFAELELVLVYIASNEVPDGNSIKAVPSGKLEANALSNYTKSLLILGMQRTVLVESLFKNYYDPELGDKVAKQFIIKYQGLRDTQLLPDDIFSEIYNWAIGEKKLTSKIQVAVYTIMAYFFERCDIFEPPKCERLE